MCAEYQIDKQYEHEILEALEREYGDRGEQRYASCIRIFEELLKGRDRDLSL